MVLVTLRILTKAIQNSVEHEMDEKTARNIAERILNFFGYDDRIYDNILTPQERDVFNMLESVGLLSTTSEELTLYNGKEWRIYYWILNGDKILKASKKIREKKGDYKAATGRLEKQQVIETDLSDTDQAITEFFKKADEEHEKVQKFYDESQKIHEDYMKMVKEIAASINESNKKHKKYLEVREEAQRHHEKAMEMRSKVLSIRKDRRKNWLAQ